jgi:hypothetical protein
MKDLKKLINDRIEEFSKSGKFTEQIDKQIENMFKSVMQDVFSAWGEPVKQLKQKIIEELDLTHLKLDLPSYNKMITNIVRDQMESEQVSKMKERAAEMMKDLFNPLGKHHWGINEIITKFKDSLYGSGEITFEVEWSEAYTGAGKEFCHVYFDERPDVSQYSCSYCLNTMTHTIKDDKGNDKKAQRLWGGTIKGVPSKDIKTPLNSQFDIFMFQLLAEEVTIDMNDAEFVEKDYYEHEED